ncbi:MAG: winged helix-turn-helix domain-containing protein [Pyrinomonadaceae bacterium]
MSQKSVFYKFAGLRFSPEAMQLEVLETGQKINLTPTHCRFLLALLEKAQTTVTFEDLRQTVWANQIKTDESLKRLIQTTKGDFVKSLKQLKINTDFIESVAGAGYRLNAQVTIDGGSADTQNFAAQENFSTIENKFVEKPVLPSKIKKSIFGKHAVYVLVGSLLYGLLFWIALMLEVAYQFDRFGTKAVWLGLPLVLWIGGTSFFGLIRTENLIRQDKRNSLFVGLLFFIGGAVLACLAMSFFLPNEPITVAHFQSQPAFAAFVKNSLMYFLPLGVVFILIPFHFVCARESRISTTFSAINPSFAHLFGLWLVAVMYAIFSTFYLLDNLLPAQFHGLFVLLAFLRFFVYFGLGLACLLWYKSALNFAAQ